jgi:hypothetical protein
MTRSRSALGASIALIAGFAIAACIVQAPPPQQPAPLPSNSYDDSSGGAMVSQSSLPNGDYSCSLAESGYQYPAFRCVVYTAEDGSQILDKLGGSQRIRGRIAPTAGGFRLDGQFYCPYGACDEQVSGEFVALGGQTFRGSLAMQNGEHIVLLTYLPGGFGYGGVGYGGARYGGVTYAVPRR